MALRAVLYLKFDGDTQVCEYEGFLCSLRHIFSSNGESGQKNSCSENFGIDSPG